MKLVKPATVPQNQPFLVSAGCLSRCVLRSHVFKQKPTPMKPIISLTALSDVNDAVSHPMKTPNTPAGMRIFKLGALKFLRYSHTLTTSEMM
jgi:hypothetical protein